MADEKWSISIPIDGKGGTGSARDSKDSKGMDELNKNIKKLDKTMYLNLDIIEMMTAVLGDVYKMLSPLVKILSVLFMIIFLPLLPIIKLLTESFSDFIKSSLPILKSIMKFLDKLFSGDSGGFWKQIAKLIIVGLALFFFGPLAALVLILILFKDEFALAFRFIIDIIVNSAIWMWDVIKKSFGFLVDVGKWIWDMIIEGFSFMADIGKTIWDMIMTPFRWLADKISSIGEFFGFGSGPKSSGGTYIPKSTDVMVKRFNNQTTNQGNTNIYFNNPIIRSEMDIKKIADQVSKIQRRQLSGRVSVQ